MKIVHVNNTAGVAKFLCTELRRKKHEVRLFTKTAVSVVYAYPEEWVSTLKNAYDAATLRKIDQSHPDIIHCHYLLNKVTFLTALLHRNKPIIYHAHGSDTRAKSLFLRLMRKILLRKAKHLLYSTPDLKYNLSWFRGDKIFLPNPIQVPEYMPYEPLYKERILIYGTLYRLKKIDQILDLVSTLPYHFDIIDWGPDREYFSKRFPSNVTPVPVVKHADVSNFLRKYPLVIGASWDGTIRMSELDAMALGVPTLFPFKYNQAYMKPLPMPELTAKAIQAHIGDFELGRQQRAWVKEFHSVEVVVEKLLAIYQKVLLEALCS